MHRLILSSCFALTFMGCWPYIANPVDGSAASLGDDDDDDDVVIDTVGACPAPNLGPWGGHPMADAGVTATSQRYDTDANLQAVRQLAVGSSTHTNIDEWVNNAVVVAVEEPNPDDSGISFWVADASGALLVYKGNVEMNLSNLLPGDRVSFDAVEVLNYQGMAEVTSINRFEVEGSGADVWVVNGNTGRTLVYDDYPSEVLEVWGEAASVPADCGGRDCVDVDIGAPETVLLRAPTGSVRKGDCVHVIAPIQNFNGELQIDMEHPDWLRTY